MIKNDNELLATQERISLFESYLTQIRQNARPEEFELVAGGYLSELAKMQSEVLAFLSEHASKQVPAHVA